MPELGGFALVLLALCWCVPTATEQVARCLQAPPRLWRHWGCGRWDCGDLGGSYEGCRAAASGTECSPPDWNCSSENAIEATGSFACVGNSWADIVPLCSGSTSPANPGGTWQAATTEVRAVLIQLNISWSSPTSYRPDICTRTFSGELAPPCERLSFGELLEKNLWPFIAQPLQSALCSTSSFEAVSDILALCTGLLSQHGDRLRVAAVAGDLPQDSGSMLVYFDAVPFRPDSAELLREDLTAAGAALDRLVVNGTTVRDVDIEKLDATTWFLEGFHRLLHHPEAFNIRSEGGFTSGQWFPTLELRASQPYIINQRTVPDWRFRDQAVEVRDDNAQAIETLSKLEDVALWCLCGFPAAAWVANLAMRFAGWRCLFGRKSQWQFAQTSCAISIAAALTQMMELAAVVFVFFLTVWLGSTGILDDIPGVDFRHPELGMLLLPIPLVIMVPSLVLGVQLIRPCGESPLPRQGHACCFNLRRDRWRKLLMAALGWHAAASLVATATAVFRLSFGAVALGVAHKAAVHACGEQQASSCNLREVRQLNSFSRDHREFCAQDCSTVPTPSEDVLTALEICTYRLTVAISICALFACSLQFWVAWTLGDPQMEAAQATADAEAVERDRASAQAESTHAQASVAAPEEQPAVSSIRPMGEATLTPALFEEGVREAEERQQRVEENRKAQSAAPSEDALPPLTPNGNAAMERILAAVSLVDDSGEGLPPGLAQLAGDERLNKDANAGGGQLLAGLSPRDEKDLLDFAQKIARQCSRDSFTSKESKAAHSEHSIDSGAESTHSKESSVRGSRAGDRPRGPRRTWAPGEDNKSTPGSARSTTSSGKPRFVADW